jgi:two-component system sensor histidine kinase KdpD
MCVPLIHRSELLGVLNINARTERKFTEYDLRALSLFAEQAASAIANARLYEIERMHVAELVEGEVRKTEFLAAVSHDLRTPLTSLIGCSKMLQRQNLSEAHRVELASMVDRQALRLNRMIEDLLTAARLEAEAPPALQAVDAGALLNELRAEFSVSGFAFALDVVDGPLLVQGRPESLRRVFTNLIENAFKHGGGDVRVAAVANSDGQHIEIAVRDSGPGVPTEDRDRIFERFWRLDKNRQAPGIGLGLSIVQGLVAGCGGKVWCEARDDGESGTVMRVRLRVG